MFRILFTLFFFIIADISFAITIIDNTVYKINGVQIFNFDKKYRYQLDDYFKTLKSHNVNAVFLRVFQNNSDRVHFNEVSNCDSGVYFKSEVTCTVFDLLDLIIPYAKKYDIKVFAWMATRSLSFLKEKYGYEIEIRDKKMQNGYGVNIFKKGARDSLITLFKELASYDIDGILIQDDFILRMGEGISGLSSYRYSVDYGKLPSVDDYDWFKWKVKNLSDFLNELRYETRKVNPKIKFAVNIYYETPLDASKGLKWYSQTIERYKELGFSYFAVMGYHEQIMNELNLNFNESLEVLNKMLNNLLSSVSADNILMKIQVRKFNSDKSLINSKEVNSICTLIKNYKTGIVLVPFESLSDLNNTCF
ncbi:MAG: poly-beta,6-N-acetyl-D-glucosamine N-deacetylase [Deferribacteres bacterium]|jgi:biofilm PGA synthesis lipoprotein PgaB|nr:poly-beta,6-N-acetyl-D-glucosamine N-deacetylase [Deferribacteres bacterium]